MAGLDGTQALLLVLITLILVWMFSRPRGPRRDWGDPFRERPGWLPEEHRRWR
jgi:hypothetical protein